MKKGFTLVELLVVVAILGVLAAVGIVSFGGFLGSAKENVSKSNHILAVKLTQTTFLKCSMSEQVILKKYFNEDTGEFAYVNDFCTLLEQKNENSMASYLRNHLNSPKVCNPYGLAHSSGTCQEAFAIGGQLGNPRKLGETQFYGNQDNDKIVIQTKISESEFLYDEFDLNNL